MTLAGYDTSLAWPSWRSPGRRSGRSGPRSRPSAKGAGAMPEAAQMIQAAAKSSRSCTEEERWAVCVELVFSLLGAAAQDDVGTTDLFAWDRPSDHLSPTAYGLLGQMATRAAGADLRGSLLFALGLSSTSAEPAPLPPRPRWLLSRRTCSELHWLPSRCAVRSKVTSAGASNGSGGNQRGLHARRGSPAAAPGPHWRQIPARSRGLPRELPSGAGGGVWRELPRGLPLDGVSRGDLVLIWPASQAGQMS